MFFKSYITTYSPFFKSNTTAFFPFFKGNVTNMKNQIPGCGEREWVLFSLKNGVGRQVSGVGRRASGVGSISDRQKPK